MSTDGAWGWIDDNYSDEDFGNLDADAILTDISRRQEINNQMKGFLGSSHQNVREHVDDAKATRRLIKQYDEPSDTQTLLGEIDNAKGIFRPTLRDSLSERSVDVYADKIGQAESRASVSQIMRGVEKDFDGDIPDQLASAAESMRQTIEQEQIDTIKPKFREYRDILESSQTERELDANLKDMKDDPLFRSPDKIPKKRQLKKSLDAFAEARREMIKGQIVPEEFPEFETKAERTKRR